MLLMSNKKHRLYKGVARKLIVSTILFSSFITLIITAIQLYQGYKYDLEIIDSRFQQINDVHLTSVTNNVWLADKKEALIQLNGILKTPDIQYLEIREGDSLWIKAGFSKKSKAKSKTYQLKYSYKDKILDVGTLKVVASLENTYQHIYDNALVVLITNGIKTSLVAFFIFILFSNIISRHLIKISDFALENNPLTSNKTLSLNRKQSQKDELDIVVASINDMRHRLSKQLNEINEKKQYLSLTLNSIGDAVITTDAKGLITHMNPVAELLTGWLIEEAEGQSIKIVFSVINATTRETIENPIDIVMSTGETVYLSNHTTLIAKDGTEYQIADSASPIRNEDEITLGMVLIFNNVTEQYKMREEIRSSAQHLKLYREQAPMATIEWNTDFQVVDWNVAAEKMFGYTVEEVKGENFVDIMLPESAIVNVKEIWRDLMAQTGGELSINENITKDGRTILCEWHNTPLKDESGKIIGAASIVQDITERQQKEDQLRQSQKLDALGKLTGGVAHDFNNILGVVLGYAGLLKDISSEQPDVYKYAEQIYHAGERGSKLTRKLLSFSRQKESNDENHNLNTLLHNNHLLLEKTLTARIKLIFDLADDLWDVSIDDNDLEDAILNISINSMHAIDGNGTLTFQTRNEVVNQTDAQLLQMKEGDYVSLSISDSGSGMDKITKDKIFEPFFSTKGELGTGLGLSQVYGFVDRCRGAIKVYSELNHGTRLILYFPRAKSSKFQKPLIHINNINDVKGTETILVVDDESALLDLTALILSQQGYQIFKAESAQQALEILEVESIDLLLSDVIMPDMDGYKLSKVVHEKYPHIKIQLASGFSDDRHLNMGHDALHKELLHKPFNSQTLFKRIRELLG